MIWTIVLNFKFSPLYKVDAYIFCFTSAILPVKFDILESENFFDAEVYLQQPNDDLNSGKDSDLEEETDPQYL